MGPMKTISHWSAAFDARRAGFRGSIVAGVIVAAAAPTALQAQTVTPPTRGELNPPQRDPVRPPTTLTVEGGIERLPCALDNPQYADIRMTLSGVRFEGAAKAPDVDLGPTYQAYLGRELPLSILCDIRSAANRRLQDAGYLATVEIPPQRLADGNAEMRIVFGKLTALRVRGDAGPSERLVAARLGKLTEDEVFNVRTAERYLLLADDVPGLDVRLGLRPAAGGNPGELVGEVAIVRHRGVLDFNVQNFGSKALGRFGGVLRGELYGLTGLADRTSLSLFSTLDTDEQQTIQLGHDFALGSEGFRLGGQFTYSWTNPDIELSGFDLKSETLFATVNASYPLQRTRTATHVASAGLDFVDQDVRVNGLGLSRDRIRMAFLRLDSFLVDEASIAGANGYSSYEPRLSATGTLELRQGLSVFDASPDCRSSPLTCILAGEAPARIEADPTPFLARFEGRADYRPVSAIRFSLGVNAQWSPDPLPAFEEFAAGNYTIGRGYDPGSVLGDSGYGLSLEAAYGSSTPGGPNDWSFQPYVFSDVAWAWNEDPSRSPLNPDQLWSAGGGLRLAWGSRMRADVALALPLERPDLASERGDVRLLVSLTTRLAPWSY